ncbi:conserved hypothetical protein [Cupriavidus taiwanensis]|uniref:hypothetical protein n=1 Tax=Cupriavidus taiwanensis TaxID=164546 RepID=UPI000E179DE4|nr:hypothetical protein [Cupriavidus taiwanensis]SOZ99492.1 conserved hypothetical protein [Cupriavidus taiwanensis]
MKTVRQALNAPHVWSALEPEISAIDADSVVGAAVVTLLDRVEQVLLVEAEDGGRLDSDVYYGFVRLALHQANVWYFG